jgi:hypothetical protein
VSPGAASLGASNAAQAFLMPNAVARFAPGLRHGWLARDPQLHVRMVEAWLTDRDLPSELRPETPSPPVVERLLRELGDGRLVRPIGSPLDRANDEISHPIGERKPGDRAVAPTSREPTQHADPEV